MCVCFELHLLDLQDVVMTSSLLTINVSLKVHNIALVVVVSVLQRSGVYLSVYLSVCPTAVYTQTDSPGSSTRRGQRTFSLLYEGRYSS